MPSSPPPLRFDARPPDREHGSGHRPIRAVSSGAMNLPPPPPPRASGSSTGTLTCYRHPNREAGRRCTRCGKPACAECLVQASVGSHCVDCARLARPDTKTRAKYWNARQTTLVTYALILTNVLVFVYVLIETKSVLGDVNAVAYQRLGLARDAVVRPDV